jgi:hypothetical protein
MVKIKELQNLVEKLDIDEVLKFNLRQFIDFGTTSGSEFLEIKKIKEPDVAGFKQIQNKTPEVMAHWYSTILDPGTSEEVLGSNPVVCMSKSCWPFESL